MITQGIKDRSKIREHMVIKKQGHRDESEAREEEPGEDPEMGVHRKSGDLGEDPGKIHRSKGVRCSGVLGEKGMRVRTSEGESFRCLVGNFPILVFTLKTVSMFLLTLTMTSLLLFTCPLPLAMGVSFAPIPYCLGTTSGQVCPPLSAALSLAVPFANR